MLAFLALICASLALSLLSMSVNMSAVNRIIINTPKSLFEASIPVIVEGDFVPCFDQTSLKINLTIYYKNNLEKYTDNYSFKTYYYNPQDGSFCAEQCRAVEVRVTAYVNFNYQINRTIFYEIQEGVYGD